MTQQGVHLCPTDASILSQDMVSRLNALNVEFARHRDVAVKMRRDLDLAAIRENELKIKVGEIDKVERLYHILEARARDLEIQKVYGKHGRDRRGFCCSYSRGLAPNSPSGGAFTGRVWGSSVDVSGESVLSRRSSVPVRAERRWGPSRRGTRRSQNSRH